MVYTKVDGELNLFMLFLITSLLDGPRSGYFAKTPLHPPYRI